MLEFDQRWRYESPGESPVGIMREFLDIITKVAGGEQGYLEHFKKYFASASGNPPSRSSSESWAHTDLTEYMRQSSKNAPLFIEAFYDSCENLRNEVKTAIPDVQQINKILAKHNAPYRIEPPNLIMLGLAEITPPPEIPKSFEQQVQEEIKKSINNAKQFLSEGKNRQAVQEVLWLLETVSTAFADVNESENSINGKYFNQIIRQLRHSNKGTALEQIIDWITKLHGYLSAPAGGGVRHGMHIKEGVAISPNEAKLYYSLINGYVTYLLSEYETQKNKK